MDDFFQVFNPSRLRSILVTGSIAAIALASWLCLASAGDRNMAKPELVGPPTKTALRNTLKPTEKLVYSHHESLAGLDREIDRTRILDQRTKRVREVIQTANGPEPLDYSKLRQLNREALRTKFGAGGEGFDAKMDNKPAVEALFTVQFVAGTDFATAAQEISNLGAKIDASYRDLVSIKTLPSVAKKIARMATVDSVVQEQPKTVQAVLMARDLGEAPLVPKHAAGFGKELLAAIWEPNACINRIHPDFSRVQWQSRFGDACDVKGGEIVFHSTMVANCFAAFRAEGTAGLYQGRIFDVDDTSMQARNDMWSRKPNIVNASFTTSVFDGRQIDEEVYVNRTSHVFLGVGNILTNGEGVACFGYNALCVGGYLNQNTVGGFTDDTLGPTSWQNQFGVEKPQVLGPFNGTKMATSFFHGAEPNYDSHGGSSFATPAVAGLAALLIANYPFDLTKQPEAVRAILMASAQAHPIISNGRAIPDFNDNIDDKMGVGAPNGTRAKDILENHTFRYGSFLPRIAGQPGLGRVSFTASRGDLVRVVLTWDQCPDYNVGDPQLSVDLDMVVEAPSLFGPGNGTQLITNFSQHDNWEVVEFMMARSGPVSIHVSVPVFRPCSRASNPQLVNYGLAWTKTRQVNAIK